MTEYATTPSAIEEWNSQRNRTADWVQHNAVPGLPPPPTDDSDSDKHSLWDGSGWEPPSDCESSTSVPPSMILQYADSRQVLVSPTTSHADENNGRSPSGSRYRARRTHTQTQSAKRDQENTERTRSLRSAQAVVPQSEPHAGVAPTQTSSMRLARAAAAPLPDSHSSSSEPRSTDVISTSRRSVPSSALAAGPAGAGPSVHSHAPSNRPSHASSHHPSVTPSHPPHFASHHTASQHPSHVPSHQPSHILSHQPSQAPSQHTAHALSEHQQPSHPPSAFSNHTVVPPPPMAAGASPPSIHSIQSRSISLAESRSSGPPEPIVVHPPSATSSHSTAGPSPSHTHSLGQGHGGVYPQMHAPTASIRTQSAAHVPLPPPSIASKSLSYYSVPRQSHVYEQHQQIQEQQRQSVAPSHHVSQVQQNAQLPTPVSPTQNAHAPYTSSPSRAASVVTANGLGDGFVLVDAPSPGYEKELERELNEKKGSGKSTGSQRRERGSLFNVFGGVRPGGHNRSRSLPMAGVDAVQGGAAIGSPTSPYGHAPHHSQQNPYLTPISPTSPMNPYDPMQGPRPPPIVYAPARHHRATHYAPPRIMYMPASPPGQRRAPYDTHQYTQMHAHAYPQQGTTTGLNLVYATAPGRTAEYGAGDVRRSRTVNEEVRDSGWGEGKRDGSAVRLERGADAADIVARDFAHEGSHTRSPTSPNANAVHANFDSTSAAATPPASHAAGLSDAAHAPSVQSDATSTHTNMAGVGTATARSRSRGRDRLEGHGNGSERSRSRARGMVYSTSAPQPQGSAPPHAAMMIPPSTTRDRGVRDTPYPTPPGSASEYQHRSRQQQRYSPVSGVGINGHALGSLSEKSGEAYPSQGGLASRFRDYYHSSHGASPGAADAMRDSASTSPNRGRTRERRRKESHPKLYKSGRARSVESQTSRSSASTYYVLPTPGQKVRIIRADGQTVTTTTSVSRNPPGGGWLKKATRFLHRDATSQEPSEKRKRDPATAPALASSRTPSHGSGVGSTKSGSKRSGRKLVRRNSTGSAALLSQASVGAGAGTAEDRDVDIVIPGQ